MHSSINNRIPNELMTQLSLYVVTTINYYFSNLFLIHFFDLRSICRQNKKKDIEIKALL